MSERIFSGVCGTSGFPLTASGPVRFYTTGTKQFEVAPATGGEDALVQGISRRGVATAGVVAAVMCGLNDTFLGSVATTVVIGDKMKVKNRGQFSKVGATAGLRFVAQVIKPRTNTGLCWLQFVPGGII